MSINTPAPQDQTTIEQGYQCFYHLVSNTRMIALLYNERDNLINFQVNCLEPRSNLVLDITIPGYNNVAFKKLLAAFDIKDKIDDKCKAILDKFNWSHIKSASFLSEQDFEEFVRVEIWPQFNYTKTDLAKASYYLPKDDKGNHVVDINTDIGDLSFYKSVLECEKLINTLSN